MRKNFFNYGVMTIAVALFGMFVVGCNSLGDSSPEEEYDILAGLDPEDRVECIKRANIAINNGDYSSAYAVADIMWTASYGTYAAREMNTKVLKNEIAAFVDEDEGGNTAGKIIFAINEKAPYCDSIIDEKNVESMLKYAIQLAQTLNKDELLQKLEDVLDGH